jgi:hypothetical protein
LGTDDLVNIYDLGTDTLEVVADLLEAFGGLRTIIPMVVAWLSKMYQPQLATFLGTLGVGI